MFMPVGVASVIKKDSISRMAGWHPHTHTDLSPPPAPAALKPRIVTAVFCLVFSGHWMWVSWTQAAVT